MAAKPAALVRSARFVLAGGTLAIIIALIALDAGKQTTLAEPTVVPPEAARVGTQTPEPWQLDPNYVARSPQTLADMPGAEAIKPTRPDAPLGEATFSEADAAAFVTELGAGPLMARVRSGEPRVESVVFMTEREMRETYNKTTQRPNTTLLCLVFTKGDYEMEEMDNVVMPFTTGLLVFHARTGNLLLSTGFE